MQRWESNPPALIRDSSLGSSQGCRRTASAPLARTETHHEESTRDAVLTTLQAQEATAYRAIGHIIGCTEEHYGIVLDLFWFKGRTTGREREELRWIREEKARKNRGLRGQKGPVLCKQALAQDYCLVVPSA